MKLFRSAALALAALVAAPAWSAPAADYDVVIRNGRVLDGGGDPWVRADVAVKAGLIARVGTVRGRGAREIDARGRYVSPGFIDMMDQSQEVLLKAGRAENKLRMGVTTVIAGEAGVPVAADGIGGYFDQLARQGIGVNICVY